MRGALIRDLGTKDPTMYLEFHIWHTPAQWLPKLPLILIVMLTMTAITSAATTAFYHKTQKYYTMSTLSEYNPLP